MLKQGDCVLYETVGVCRVKEISRQEFLNKDRLYYSMTPVYQRDTVIYVPVDSDKVRMRPVMSRREAEELIKELPQIQGIEAGNDKERFQTYKKLLFSGDSRQWAALIKGLLLVRKKRMEKGCRMAVRDEEGMKTAQKLLHEELAMALDILPGEVPEYIRSRLEGTGNTL